MPKQDANIPVTDKVTYKESTMSHAALITGFKYVDFLQERFLNAPCGKEWSKENQEKYKAEYINMLRDILRLEREARLEKEPFSSSCSSEPSTSSTPSTSSACVVVTAAVPLSLSAEERIFEAFLSYTINDNRPEYALSQGGKYFTPSQAARLVLARILELARVESPEPNNNSVDYVLSELEKRIGNFLGLPLVSINMQKLRDNLRSFALEAQRAVETKDGKCWPAYCARGVSNIFVHAAIGLDPECKVIQNEHEHALGLLSQTLDEGLGKYLSELPLERQKCLWQSWGELKSKDGADTEFAKMLHIIFGEKSQQVIHAELKDIGMRDEQINGYLKLAGSLEHLDVPFSFRMVQFKTLFADKYSKFAEQINALLSSVPQDQKDSKIVKDCNARLEDLYKLLVRYDELMQQSQVFDLKGANVAKYMEQELQEMQNALKEGRRR